MKTLRLSRKKVLITTALVLALVLVVLFVGYRNREVINRLYHFSDANLYGEDIVLFYDTNCSHCTRVDDFIENNNMGEHVDFVRLEISGNPVNATILEDKAQICGLDAHQIGVPFLWDGKNKKCLLGYIDIINFFKLNLKKP